MKKITIVCFAALALFSISCSQKEKNMCTFNGALNDARLDGKTVYLYDYKDKTLLDSAVIENGMFTFSDTVNEAKIGFVQTEPLESVRYYLYYIMEPGTVYGDLVTDSLSGTPLNDTYYNYQKRKYDIEAEVMAAVEKASLATPDEADAANATFDSVYNALFNEYKKCTSQFFDDNKGNILGVLAAENLCQAESYGLKEFTEILAGAAPVVRDYPSIQRLLEHLQILENTAPGKQYVDVDLLDTETGEMRKLSSYIDGKVTLIDFWASWCGPCRRAIPYIAEMYGKYADKGLTVVGLNVWDTPEKQAEVIKLLNMTWIQVADTTSEKTVSKIYGVNEIPQILLIDANGIIVARNLDVNNMEGVITKTLGLN